MVYFPTIFTALTLLSSAVSAHPGEHEEETLSTLARRAQFFTYSKRSLAACKDTVEGRDLEARAIARRSAFAEEIRQQRGIVKRSTESVLATDHKSNLTGLTGDVDPKVLFSGDVKCVLQPEVTQGPYYVNGELIRHDVRDGQSGIDLYADIQVVDIKTCKPIPNLYLDWWHANASGVYSGVVANGNGDSSDATNINKTFARGVRPTSSDGVAQVLSIFPGYYTGRTTHVHILAHVNATLYPNQTLSAGHNAHVGQFFFDQSLISAVSTVAPYSNNKNTITPNTEDTILGQEAGSMDPLMEYALLGDGVEDGILAWITVGVDSSAQYSVSSAATWTAHGGVANAGGMGPGAGGSGPPGSAPSGSSTTTSGAASSGFHSVGILARIGFVWFGLSFLSAFLCL